MFKLIKYLAHRISATNEHGIHSPFVYDYVTHCLYKKTAFEGSKSMAILLKSIQYFEIESVKLISGEVQFQQKIRDSIGASFHQKKPFDLIYAANPLDKIKIDPDEVQNNTLIFVDAIYDNHERLKAWEHIKANINVTASLDLFYCGLLFLRKEQVKEHFKIRI